ncbi:hypothetical protein BDP55DRAFT_236488 [Colletotrichum godetiae]|uniref:Uncharacterized protein n=1 Tax=Colletotrichum godetiae TaxID=1209918 RepID=A0AAJ0AFJ9_9PEZI|nr:uncharacterized protein BDP55DRAFT_236488 [Colletotrichum godetiae]KAK1672971.1 hypothetical protein BDP55DRAFT_236488 [Colletotrichum godetiae]
MVVETHPTPVPSIPGTKSPRQERESHGAPLPWSVHGHRSLVLGATEYLVLVLVVGVVATVLPGWPCLVLLCLISSSLSNKTILPVRVFRSFYLVLTYSYFASPQASTSCLFLAYLPVPR